MQIRIMVPASKAKDLKAWIQMRFGIKVYQDAPEGDCIPLSFDAPMRESLRLLLEDK